MSDTVLVGLISGGASLLTAVTALILNDRGFTSIDSRLSGIDSRITALETRIDNRLAAIQADLKEFYRLLADLDKRISRLEGGLE
jgi:hypothetical protein